MATFQPATEGNAGVSCESLKDPKGPATKGPAHVKRETHIPLQRDMNTIRIYSIASAGYTTELRLRGHDHSYPAFC